MTLKLATYDDEQKGAKIILESIAEWWGVKEYTQLLPPEKSEEQ